MTEGDKHELRLWLGQRRPDERVRRLVEGLMAECAELKRLNLALAGELAACEHLGRVAEKRTGEAK